MEQRLRSLEKMGSPPAGQVAELEKAGQLQRLAAPKRRRVNQGERFLDFSLPRQGVFWLKLTRKSIAP
ncbi:MAG: hypothetical protein H7Z75_13830 [Ferruginibacter sp.]|nr:hypothetical protein [Cytophagales bacterium]